MIDGTIYLGIVNTFTIENYIWRGFCLEPEPQNGNNAADAWLQEPNQKVQSQHKSQADKIRNRVNAQTKSVLKERELYNIYH